MICTSSTSLCHLVKQFVVTKLFYFQGLEEKGLLFKASLYERPWVYHFSTTHQQGDDKVLMFLIYLIMSCYSFIYGHQYSLVCALCARLYLVKLFLQIRLRISASICIPWLLKGTYAMYYTLLFTCKVEMALQNPQLFKIALLLK